jgi:hypothetical protein
MTVYLVWSGEYVQRDVSHVCASLDAVPRVIRASYASCGSRIDSPDAVTPDAYGGWDYAVNVLHQCGHDLVTPIVSQYEIEEVTVSE